MIIADINMLLYATLDSFAQHAKARAWWEAVLVGDREIGLPIPVVFGYVRIATNRKVFSPPLSVASAIGRVEEWLASPVARLIIPGPRHLEIAFRLLTETGTAANLTTDAQIAAAAIELQAELHSNDSDFGRFKGLQWVNPLAE